MESIKFKSNLSKRIIAQETIDKWKAMQPEVQIQVQAREVENVSLKEFFSKLILIHKAPIKCLPEDALADFDFLKSLVKSNPSILNEIYMLDDNHYIYNEFLPDIDVNELKRLLKSKHRILPNIRSDMKYLTSCNYEPKLEDCLPIPKCKKKQ